VNNLVDTVSNEDKLFHRAPLKVSASYETGLDNTALMKPGHFAASSSSAGLRPTTGPRLSSALRASPVLHPSWHRPGGNPQFRKDPPPVRRTPICRIGVSEIEDPNLTPGAVRFLKTVDTMDTPAFDMVQVRVYNIDRYGMSPLAAKALNKNIEAIWHVGVAVFGREYWFGAIVEAQSLADVDYAFGFGPTHVYNIGRTQLNPEEFHAWVFDEMAPKYNVDSYDCFNHNCHHFANELVMKLTGKTPAEGGFPKWCLSHGENALSEISDGMASRIKWVSNRIAKVMMISWGKYNRERFVSKGTTSQDDSRGVNHTMA